MKELPKSRQFGVGPHECQGKKQEGKTSEKNEEKKGIEAQRAKNPTPSRATDELIGDEEQNGKKKRTK